MTVDEVMARKPCYTRSRVEKFWGGERSLSAFQILLLPIPGVDRLWALTRSHHVRIWRRFACFVIRASGLEGDGRIVGLVERGRIADARRLLAPDTQFIFHCLTHPIAHIAAKRVCQNVGFRLHNPRREARWHCELLYQLLLEDT